MESDLNSLLVKVAELCGWTEVAGGSRGDPCERIWRKNGVGFRWYELPRYPSDLNACAAFEKMLTAEQCELYQAYLSYGEGYIDDGYAATEFVFHTPAEQRCRAFVAVMDEKKMNPLTGKWITRCLVCSREYENGVGSTECCGAVQEIVWHDPQSNWRNTRQNTASGATGRRQSSRSNGSGGFCPRRESNGRKRC